MDNYSTVKLIMNAFGPGYWLMFGFVVVFTLVLLAIRLRAFRTSRGIVEGAKSTIQQNIDVAAVNIEVAKERLEVERALLAVQQDTNALLKQFLARLDQRCRNRRGIA